MGLDSVELVMEVEKAFDIRIPDEQAEKMITVGAMHDWVWNNIEKKQKDKCASQALFYKLRKYCTESFDLPNYSFAPGTLLNDVFPSENRRKQYASFATAVKLELPRLILPSSWSFFLNTVGIICILGGLIYSIFFAEFLHYTKWVYLAPVAGIIFTLLISRSLNFKRIIISPFLVKDFTQKTFALNFASLKDKGTNRKDVVSVINHIISEKLGVDLEEVTPEKSFTDDLGVS